MATEFKIGDKVRFTGTPEDLEAMGIGESAHDEIKNEVGTIVRERDGTSVRVKYPVMEWWIEVANLELAEDEPREFSVGDKVKVVGTVESLVELGIRESRAREMVGKTFEILTIKDGCRTTGRSYKGHELNTSKGTEWNMNYWVEAKDLELMDASDEDEPDWDPMTEPIHVGDLVEVVYDGEHKGKRGRVTRCDNPERGRWGVTQDNGSSAGDSWSRRTSLKLIEKAEGSPKAGVKAKESPPPGLAQGDQVRILHSTREFQEMGHNVISAARLSRRKGKIVMIDGAEPKWYVDVPGVGGSWCRTDKLEKLTA